jgi:prephenate dehydrogenase
VRSEPMQVGIIGGTGKMGRFFADVFSSAGWDVIVSGRNTPLTNCDVAGQADVVMVSVPIRDTVRVIAEIAPRLSERQILCDLTSLKAEPVRALLASPARVIGLHPMFGPGAESLRGQTIIVTPARCGPEDLALLLDVFERQGAVITVTTPEEHDRMMAVIQGLTHFSTLAAAETIRKKEVDVEQSLSFTSPIYRIQMGLIGRLLSQDPDLYADMLRMNPAVPGVLAAFEDAVRDLRSVVESDDPARFREYFGRNARHYEGYGSDATRETDDLIRCVVNR